MREDTAGDLLARCYGLALGLALGAAACMVPPAWREAVAGACWVGAVEAGPVPGGACAGMSSEVPGADPVPAVR